MKKIDYKYVLETEKRFLQIKEALKEKIRELKHTPAAKKVVDSGGKATRQHMNDFEKGNVERSYEWVIGVAKALFENEKK
ncbi:MAG: hypothetical protein GY754_18050 [bacterium]|nr:hypothetical protein [bacterium]